MRSVLSMSRGELLLAANPTKETLADVKATIEKRKPELERNLAAVEQQVKGEQTKLLLGEVRASYQRYLTDLELTIAAAEKAEGQVALTEAQHAVLERAMASRAEARKLEDAVSRFIADIDEEAHHLAEAADSTAATMSNLMMGVALGGMAAGLGLAWLVAQAGVVAPLRRIVDALSRLANGDLEVDVYGAARKDEIADIARTMQVFKDNAIEKTRLEEAQALARGADQRRQEETDQLIGFFGRTVSGVLQSLSGSSAEMSDTSSSLERSANTTGKQADSVMQEVDHTATTVQRSPPPRRSSPRRSPRSAGRSSSRRRSRARRPGTRRAPTAP